MLPPKPCTRCRLVSEIQRLREIMATLRGPGGCPWDREQTHQSLTQCLVEECSETLQAIDNEDFQNLQEELGDLLLQVTPRSLRKKFKHKKEMEGGEGVGEIV